MISSQTIIVGLSYILFSIILVLIANKYYFNKKSPPKEKSSIDNNYKKPKVSILDDLELEDNIFDSLEEEDLSSFEIDNIYNKKTTDDFLNPKEKEFDTNIDDLEGIDIDDDLDSLIK